MVFGFLRQKEKKIGIKPTESDSIEGIMNENLKKQRIKIKMLGEELKLRELEKQIFELEDQMADFQEPEPTQEGQSLEQMFTAEAINWFKNQQNTTPTPSGVQMPQQEPQQLDFAKYITIASKMPLATLKPIVAMQTKDIDKDVIKQALDNIARCL